MNWLSLLVPFAYLGILVSSLATFSSLYRKRINSRAQSLAPYFPPHTARNIYLSLLHLSDDNKVPDSILRAALLARAQEDIIRIIEIRTRKQGLSTLLARGVVGDEIWQRLLRAEQELEVEVKDVVQEANAFAPNWGQTIFQSASEMAANSQLKKKLAAIAAGVEPEKEWWEQKRASVKEGFMKELDEDAAKKQNKATPATPAPTVETATKGPVSDGSEEEAVLVETPAQAAAAAAVNATGAGGGSVKGKKKKAKK